MQARRLLSIVAAPLFRRLSSKGNWSISTLTVASQPRLYCHDHHPSMIDNTGASVSL